MIWQRPRNSATVVEVGFEPTKCWLLHTSLQQLAPLTTWILQPYWTEECVPLTSVLVHVLGITCIILEY